MVDAEDDCRLEEEVGCVPTQASVDYVDIILEEICNLLYCLNCCEMADAFGFFVVGRKIA